MFTNIMQWNCEGIQSKINSGDALQYIKESGAQILVWQETKLAKGQLFRIKGFKSYLKNLEVEEPTHRPHGGVGIFVKNFASSYQVKLTTPLQAIAVSVKIHTRITICSIYLPPNEQVQLTQLQNLIDQLPKPYLLLGDFNAHHPMWHDPRTTDDRGRTIVNLIAKNDIALLDQNKMTHIWKVDKSLAHVDLSICSTELLPWFQWDVHEETLNSDHFPILLKTRTADVERTTERWRTEKADWERYRESTATDTHIEEYSSVDEAADFFETHIKDAASKFIPRTKNVKKTKSPPWWNKWCRAAVQKRKASFRRYQKATTMRNYIAFSKARAQAKRQVKTSKRASWSQFISSINKKSRMRDIWKKINLLNNKFKSEVVHTLFLNKKEVKISNVPDQSSAKLIEELSTLGCIQTLKWDEESPATTKTLYIRFETDEAAAKAIELDGEEVQSHILKAELLLHQDGDQPIVLDEPKDIADCLGRRFTFVSSTNSSDQRFQDHKSEAEKEKLNFDTDIQFEYNDDLTYEELLYSLNLSNDSAPGPDEITYSMLKNLAPSGKRVLLELMNCIYKGGKFPEKWKEAFIIPILKQGKESTNASSYRPIALTSCICKLLERIINRRLVWYLESKGLIDRCQSGFRRGRSTIDSLAALATDVQNAFLRKQYLFSVFFDLEKAYDTCWKQLIMQQLFKFGLRGELPKIIENFLSDRRFRVRVGDSLSDEFEQEMGVPQGGVLSCTLFNIAINTVVEVLRGLVSYSLYVDDKRISFAHTDPSMCKRRIQRVLDKLQEWAIRTGFRFSTLKTEWMVFYRNTQEPAGIQFKLDGQVLKEVKTKKFLGLIFDRMLNWQDHIDYLKGKCLKAINLLSIISKGNKETDSETLLRIYRALIRSKLDYGCEVYGTAPKKMLEKLDPVHHKAIRICLGAYRTSPNTSLYTVAGEMSLERRRKMLQMNYYIKMKQFLPHELPLRLDDKSLDGEYSRINSNKPVSLGYSVRKQITNMEIDIPNILLIKESSLGPWQRKTPEICTFLTKYNKTKTAALEFKQRFLEHRHNSDIELYTDGSKGDGKVGSGVIIVTNNKITYTTSRRLHNSASIFTAELYAIKIALLSLKTYNNVSCTIYSDSLSAIQAISSQARHRLILEIIEINVQLSKKKVHTRLCWVPGHVGILGNEQADEKAKQATLLERISTQELPPSDIKSAIKTKVYKQWKEEWRRTTIQKVKVKEVFDEVQMKPLDLKLKRRDAKVITRLQIGHTKLTNQYMLERRNPDEEEEETTRCVRCGEQYSVRHILVSCPQLATDRAKFYKPQPLQQLLTTTEGATAVIKFLHHAKLYYNI